MKQLFSIFLFGIAISSTAQEAKKDKYIPLVTKSIGASFQQFDGLNSRIANLPQFKQLKDYTATLGLGWLKEKNRIISGAGVTIGSSMSGNNDEKSSNLRFINLNIDLGYDLLKSEKAMLYPLVGLGLQGYQAIFYKDNRAVNFNDVLQSPTVQNNISSVKFNNSFLVYRLGVGVSIQSPKHPSNSIGLQAGYAGGFKQQTWRSNENQLLGNAPQDKLGQFFISLVLSSKPWFMKGNN